MARHKNPVGKMVGQFNQLVQWAGNDPERAAIARRVMQDIIDGKFSSENIATSSSSQECMPTVPSWYVSPQAQLVFVKQLNRRRNWGFEESDFPEVPMNVELRDGEVLLLCVRLGAQVGKGAFQHTFDELWELIEAPEGYAKWRWDELKSNSEHLRQVPGYDHTPGIRWMMFNPIAYHGKSPEQALELARRDNVYLAGLEVLMAALLFPTWVSSWNSESSPLPWLSGLQFKYNTVWSSVPCLGQWSYGRQLRMGIYWAAYEDSGWASPSFREC